MYFDIKNRTLQQVLAEVASSDCKDILIALSIVLKCTLSYTAAKPQSNYWAERAYTTRTTESKGLDNAFIRVFLMNSKEQLQGIKTVYYELYQRTLAQVRLADRIRVLS